MKEKNEFFFFKQRTAYERYYDLVGSEMYVRDSYIPMTSFLARGNVCVENLEPDLLIKGIRLNQVSKPLWVVFSKSTSAKLVQHFSHALNVFNQNDEHKVNIQLQTNRWTDQVCDKEKL